MWQGSLKKLGAYIYRLPYARLLITYLSADCTENIKLKRQNNYQWDHFKDFFENQIWKKSWLVKFATNKFQIVGPW